MHVRDVIVSISLIMGIGLFTVNTATAPITRYSVIAPLLGGVSVMCSVLITFTPTMYNTILKFSSVLLIIFVLLTVLSSYCESDFVFNIRTIWGMWHITIDNFKYAVFMMGIFVMFLPLILNFALALTLYYALIFVTWVLCNNILNVEIASFENVRAGMLYIVGYMLYNLVLTVQKTRIWLFMLVLAASVICFIISHYHIEISHLELGVTNLLTSIYESIGAGKLNIKDFMDVTK